LYAVIGAKHFYRMNQKYGLFIKFTIKNIINDVDTNINSMLCQTDGQVDINSPSTQAMLIIWCYTGEV